MLKKLKKLKKLKNIKKLILSLLKLREDKAYLDFLRRGFLVYSELSKNANIKSIIFESDYSIISLVDGRNFYFNPLSKIDMLYSVPQIGTFELKETEIVEGLVKEGDYCLDIGASFGWYTTLLSKKVGKDGKVFSFEPIKQNYLSHEKNLELNECYNVTSNNLAVGETKGKIDIYLSDIDTSGSLKLRGYKKNFEVQKTEVIRLDDYFEQNNIQKLDFIKIDIEGAELGAFKGCVNILNQFKPILFVEIQRHSTELFGYEPIDIFNFLYDLGYGSYIINNHKLISFDFKEPLNEYNFFFMHKDKC